MVKLKAAVQAFPAYQQILKEKQRYDFDDMINWVIDVFENNPDVLANYQEQYQFILVDEYQDTSGAKTNWWNYWLAIGRKKVQIYLWWVMMTRVFTVSRVRTWKTWILAGK